MDKREFNRRLNGLKDAYPSELPLIEGIQDLFNKRLEVISAANAHALLYNPVQFISPVRTSMGEWTTQLHIWADNLVEQLLMIDPLMLATKDSSGSTVLHSMVMAATGKFTQMMNYDYIQKMLDKNMSFVHLTIPNDPTSKTEGNAWMEKDPYGKTAMDYLIDIANGEETGMPDDQLAAMLQEFSATPVVEEPVDNTPDVPIDIDPTTGQPVEQGADGLPPSHDTDAIPAETTSTDTTTTMENPDPTTGDPGTPVTEKAVDNQARQVEQAQEELKQQPNPMLESLLHLFN